MKLLHRTVLACLLLLPTLGFANTQTTRCEAAHIVRPGANEIRFTVIFFNNGDRYPAVVERFTVRDDAGNIIHDSGPKIGVPHPLSRAPIPPQDITTVPPYGTFTLSTLDLYEFNDVPQYVGRGNRALSVTVDMATPGNPKGVVVHTRQFARERLVNPTTGMVVLGAERALTQTACFRVSELKD